MKICMIAQVEPSLHKGGGKAQYFLAQAWRRMGHSVKSIGVDQLAKEYQSNSPSLSEKAATEKFITENGAQYDIIDIDHGFLPEMPTNLPDTLIVGRSVLFDAHRFHINPPEKQKLKTKISRIIKRHLIPPNETPEEALKKLGKCLSGADLINVTSELDIESAESLGIPNSKICKFPYALDQITIDQLSNTEAPTTNKAPQMVFLGTFYYRKGCLDLVECFRQLRTQHPTLTLTLIGAKGLHQTEKEVRAFFSKEENQYLQVHMTFAPETIDKLLARKHVAIFPSYYEGFPFAVQETLAAGIPTIAYNTPGAHDLLPNEWLVEPGNVTEMCTRLSDAIASSDRVIRDKSKSIIQQFKWDTISEDTLKCYEFHLSKKRMRQTTD